MTHIVKISFLIFLLFIISCDEEVVSGCIDTTACNFSTKATESDDSCLYAQQNLDCDGNCTAVIDECGECGGNGIDEGACDCDGNVEDCAGECAGNAMDCGCGCSELCKDLDTDNILDCIDDCVGQEQYCLPNIFKWSLKMTGTIGDYNDNTFTSSTDSISNYFMAGTHYLSTDGLDILEDLSYSDIAQPPSTVENSIYLYTSHPEWEYIFGNNFTQDYKSHNMDSIIWNGYVSSDFYGEKYVKITFELESEQNVIAEVNFNLNGIENISEGNTSGCDSEYTLGNVYEGEFCSLISPQFEYIIPITFQGAGYLMPFSIKILNLVIY